MVAQDRRATVTARDEVLARLRSALAGDSQSGGVDSAADEAIPRAYRTAGSAESAGTSAVVERFIERVTDYRATVLRTDASGLTRAVAAALAGASTVVVPPGLPRAWLPEGPRIVVDDGMSAEELDSCDAVVTGANVAIADTGTIVLDGSGDQGRRAITLVPDLHVCVLRTSQIVALVPDAIARLEARRPMTWISGPSATSDIELDRVEGVHGPRTLRLVLVDDSRERIPDGATAGAPVT